MKFETVHRKGNAASRAGIMAIALVALAGCSGGDSGSGSIEPPPTNGWASGVFQPSTSFKNQCASPRPGNDPQGRPFPDVQGTTTAENNWLRSWTNDLYLWYSEVPDRNPANFNTRNYFELLKTTQTTSSGTPKDQFHLTVPTSEWQAFSQSGVTPPSYGATFVILQGTPPRRVVVSLVEPTSPAATAGLLRGDEVLLVDNVDVVNGNNTTALNTGLFPSAAGQTHTFQVRGTNGMIRNLTMVSATVTSTPVHTVSTIPTASGPVGYILFNDHIATAESGLVDAINTLRSQNIVDLVLDLRYNGGGYVAIASQLSYMIAGSSRTGGQIFERMIFNDKHPTTNPITGQALAPMPFIPQTVGLSRPAGTTLPTLNLPQPRLFVITSDVTCSASESIINGLRGIDMQVIQIGTRTCGKPYGFYDFDNCGTTYFSIQFKGANAKNFGDYTDGFTPANTADSVGTRIDGCSVDENYGHALGDPAERMLSVALSYRMSNQCSLPAVATMQRKQQHPGTWSNASDLTQPRPAYRDIRVMQGPAP